MKHLTLILLLLFSTTCWGEWTKVAGNDIGDIYIDIERIKKKGATVYYWVLGDYLKRSGGALSDISYEIGDCEMFRKKTLQMTAYRHSMGEGESFRISDAARLNDVADNNIGEADSSRMSPKQRFITGYTILGSMPEAQREKMRPSVDSLIEYGRLPTRLDRQPTPNQTANEGWRYSHPDSAGELLLKAACGQ